MLSKVENDLLTHTNPGTGAGEYFRRFWIPVALASEIAKIDGPAVRGFHARFFQPRNVEVIVAGDVFTSPSADTVLAAIRAVAGPAAGRPGSGGGTNFRGCG